MATTHEYQIRLNNDFTGKKILLDQHPELPIVYGEVSDSNLLLQVNGEQVRLRPGSKRSVQVDGTEYSFRGENLELKGGSPHLVVLVGTRESHNLGESFSLTLPENPTTGYHWIVTVSSGLTIIRDFYSSQCPRGIVGCGGEHTWILRGTKRGEQRFSAKYISPSDEVSETEVRVFRIK